MSFLEWKPEYSVGHAAVDNEHREMIATINSVFAQLGASGGDAATARRLEDVFAVVAAHFESEERIMQDAAYDEYEDHKEDHDSLLCRIRDLLDARPADPQAEVSAIGACLSDWMSRHFATFDARLHGKLGSH